MTTRTAVRPRALLLSLFGAFGRDLGGWIAVADLIELMRAVGVEPPAVRAAVSRMKKAGLLTAEARSEQAGYLPTARLDAILESGQERIYARALAPDPGEGWILAIFSVPEEKREDRYELRSRLIRLGFGSLGSAVWIAPQRSQPDLARMLAETGLERYVTVWSASYIGPAPDDRALEGAWDLDTIAGAYRSFITEHRRAPMPDEVTDALEADRRAFARYLTTLTAWRRLPFLDPGLPDALLPADWPAQEARDLFRNTVDGLQPGARRHVWRVAGRR